MNKEQLEVYKAYVKFALIIVLVIGLGFFAVNQCFKFFYTANLLNHPCDICKEANKPQAQCIGKCFEVYTTPNNREVKNFITYP